MKKILTVLLLILSLATIFAQNSTDAKFVIDKIKTIHPGYSNVLFEKEIDILNKEPETIDAMGDMEFFFHLQSIVSNLEDSHTQIGMMEIPGNLYMLPLRFIYSPDGIHIYATSSRDADMLGAKLISINGFELEELLKKANEVLPNDTDTHLKNNVATYLSFSDFLTAMGISKSAEASFLITYKQDGKTKGKILNPVLNEIENGSDYILAFQEVPTTYTNGSYYRAMALADDVLFIQYNTCQDNPQMPVSEFSRQIIETLKNGNYKKVIIDFRYNSGGNSSLLEPLIDQLAATDLKLYGLIGKDTFSSAMMNALYFKEKANATLVGTETGAKVNHYGEIQVFPLPSNRFMLQISTKYFPLNSNYESSLLPDIYVQTTFEEFAAGFDREVEYCMNDK